MELEQLGTATHPARITKLKGKTDRIDVEVEDQVLHFDALIGTFMESIRTFFERLEAEAQKRKGDPVALTHALARLETLLADLRFVHSTVKTLTAEALRDAKIRRLTVSSIATIEGTSSATRSNWQHKKLMLTLLRRKMNGAKVLVDTATGEQYLVEDVVDWVLEWCKPDWRLTPIRDLGVDPDDYCDLAKDQNGKIIRDPGVKMVDNSIRRLR